MVILIMKSENCPLCWAQRLIAWFVSTVKNVKLYVNYPPHCQTKLFANIGWIRDGYHLNGNLYVYVPFESSLVINKDHGFSYRISSCILQINLGWCDGYTCCSFRKKNNDDIAIIKLVDTKIGIFHIVNRSTAEQTAVIAFCPWPLLLTWFNFNPSMDK